MLYHLTLFEIGSEIRDGIFGVKFLPRDLIFEFFFSFWSRSPGDFWVLIVAPNRSSLSLKIRENPPGEKPLGEKRENQQQTQHTCGVDAGIWTRATLVRGERSHHRATLAPHEDDSDMKNMEVYIQTIISIEFFFDEHEMLQQNL